MNWLQRIKTKLRTRIQRKTGNYTPKGGRQKGRTLNRLLDVWHWNGWTSDPSPS